jgi:putative transposase
MAEDNPTWGYTRIVGALKNVGHRVSRSTIARVLKAHGIPPVPERPTSWQTFLRAHWNAIAGADFLRRKSGLGVAWLPTTRCSLSTSRHAAGSTPFPNDLFMRQVVRTLTAVQEGPVDLHQVLLCDGDTKWSAPVRTRLGEAGIRVVQTPYRAPNANAYAERFVRSIKEECLNRVIPIGDRHLRRMIAEYVEHYHRERNHQGLANELIEGVSTSAGNLGRIRRRPRLDGLLNYYGRAA